MSRERTRARRRALQGLYQWLVSGATPTDIGRQFLDEQDMRGVDLTYFHEMLRAIPFHAGALDTALAPWLDRPVEELDPVERTVLRIGAWELIHRPEIPVRVVLNEAIELARGFGGEKSHQYVNGVLDRLAKQVRQAELA